MVCVYVMCVSVQCRFAENSGIVVIAATNFPETLDKALLRPGRFDKHVNVPLPDIQGRRKILDLYTKETRLGTGRGVECIGLSLISSARMHVDVDMGLMARATPGFSGADLHKLVNQAKISASIENAPMLQMRHLDQSRDEMLMGAERKSFLLSEEDRRLTAFHEGGHALVALHTPHAIPLHKATIIPRGAALGLVSQVPERDEHSASRQALLARMDVAMGGRVAEELLFGAAMVTTGATSDFAQATRIARAMVMQYGMSERVGPMVVDDDELESLGPELRALIDAEVRVLLDESRMRATAIVEGRRGELDRLAAALLEHETLSKDEIVAVCRGETIRVRMEMEGGDNGYLEPAARPVLAKGRGFTIFF